MNFRQSSFNIEDLFSVEDLNIFLDNRKKAVREKISALTDKELASLSAEEFQEVLKVEFILEPITFDLENIEVIEQGNKKIDVSKDYRYVVPPGSSPYIDGQYFKLAILYTGNKELLQYRPQSCIPIDQ